MDATPGGSGALQSLVGADKERVVRDEDTRCGGMGVGRGRNHHLQPDPSSDIDESIAMDKKITRVVSISMNSLLKTLKCIVSNN